MHNEKNNSPTQTAKANWSSIMRGRLTRIAAVGATAMARTMRTAGVFEAAFRHLNTRTTHKATAITPAVMAVPRRNNDALSTIAGVSSRIARCARRTEAPSTKMMKKNVFSTLVMFHPTAK